MNYSQGYEGDYFEPEPWREEPKSNEELTDPMNAESLSEAKGVVKKGA